MIKNEKKNWNSNTQNYAYKTFHINYNGKLSHTIKLLLKSLKKKYFYHAVDDILYLLNLNLKEREELLSFIISPALSLQNNFSIDFLELWISDIYINEVSKSNKFLSGKNQNFSYITIKFLYRAKLSSYKKKLLW